MHDGTTLATGAIQSNTCGSESSTKLCTHWRRVVQANRVGG